MADTITDKGTLQKRSMRIKGHRASLALEVEFWLGLEALAQWKGATLPVQVAAIDADRLKHTPDASLASAVRVEVLKFTSSHLATTLRNQLLDKLAA